MNEINEALKKLTEHDQMRDLLAKLRAGDENTWDELTHSLNRPLYIWLFNLLDKDASKAEIALGDLWVLLVRAIGEMPK